MPTHLQGEKNAQRVACQSKPRNGLRTKCVVQLKSQLCFAPACGILASNLKAVIRLDDHTPRRQK